MNTKMIEIINQLQTVAPEIWNAAIRDSYLSAGGCAVWTAILLVGCFSLFKNMSKILGGVEYSSDKPVVTTCLWAVIGLGLFVATTLGCESLSHLISPELHAYESLLRGLK